MPDSPRCHNCIRRDVLAQTYHIAGSPHFKCQTCGAVYHRDTFSAVEFEWRTKPSEYAKFIQEKVLDDPKAHRLDPQSPTTPKGKGR